jgi:hypothetical protein
MVSGALHTTCSSRVCRTGRGSPRQEGVYVTNSASSSPCRVRASLPTEAGLADGAEESCLLRPRPHSEANGTCMPGAV